MKLKNSYILLIVMAIFLLVSIGSVCANEDVSDAALADDGSDAVLANSTGDTKKDTEIISDNVKTNDTNPQIKLTVNDTKNNKKIDVTKNDLTVKENNKTLNFTYDNTNGKATITTSLPKGNHTLTLTYLGNATYKNSTKNIVLSIFGNYAIDVPSTINVNQTQKVEVPIKLTNGVDETNELIKKRTALSQLFLENKPRYFFDFG